MIAHGRGDGLAGVHNGSDETIAQAFLSRFRELDDHQVQDQGQGCCGHSRHDLLAKVEVLVTNHIEDGQESWDCVSDCHRHNGNEDCPPPTRLQEVHLVRRRGQHHHEHAAHLEELLLQDLHLDPLVADHRPCSGCNAGEELADEGEQEYAGEALAFDQVPRSQEKHSDASRRLCDPKP